MRKALPKKLREQVKQKFDGRCAYCGQLPDKLCIDHLHPVAIKHKLKDLDIDDISNLMPACFSCNNYKSSFTLEQFRSSVVTSVLLARRYSVNFRVAERFGLISETEKTSVEFYFEQEQK